MSFDDEWDEFVESTGFVKAKDLVDHLVIIFPIGYIPHIQTINTVQGKRSDGIACDVVDLDVVGDDGNIGKLYRNNNFMQAKLIVGLRPRIGGRVLGHILVEPTAKPGRNPAYVFMSATQNPDAVARANAWLQAHPDYKPTEFIERTQVAAPAPPQQQQQQQYHQPPAVPYTTPQPQYAPQSLQGGYAPPQPQYASPQPQPPYQQQYPPQPEWSLPAPPAPVTQGVPPEYMPPPQQQQALPPATVGSRPAGGSVLDQLRALQGQQQQQLTPEEQAQQRAQYGF